jgi:hypothetical protein
MRNDKRWRKAGGPPRRVNSIRKGSDFGFGFSILDCGARGALDVFEKVEREILEEKFEDSSGKMRFWMGEISSNYRALVEPPRRGDAEPEIEITD